MQRSGGIRGGVALRGVGYPLQAAADGEQEGVRAALHPAEARVQATAQSSHLPLQHLQTLALHLQQLLLPPPPRRTRSTRGARGCWGTD